MILPEVHFRVRSRALLGRFAERLEEERAEPGRVLSGRGIKAVTFAWWKRQLPTSWGDPVQAGGRAKDRFVEVQLPGLVSMSAYEIVLADGRSIRVGSQFDPAVLTRLIAAVESS